MHPQILGTWPKGRQALDIGTQNLAPNNGKNDLFSQNWSKTNSKKNRLQDLYEIFNVHVLKTRWLNLVQLILWTGILKSIFRTGRLHYITRTRFLLRQKWWCWGNLSKNVNFFLKDIHLFNKKINVHIFGQNWSDVSTPFSISSKIHIKLILKTTKEHLW